MFSDCDIGLTQTLYLYQVIQALIALIQDVQALVLLGDRLYLAWTNRRHA